MNCIRVRHTDISRKIQITGAAMNDIKNFSSDKNGYSFLLVFITIATAAVIILLNYILQKLEIMYPQLFLRERALPEIIIYSAIGVFAAAYIIFALIFLRIWQKTLSYALTPDCIISDTGFFIRTRQIMKYSSVQYVSLVSMPFSRISSFNFVIVSALGGRLIMMFLSDSDAKSVVELIQTHIGTDRESGDGK